MLEQRRAGKADECGVGQRQPHIAGELSRLGTMRLVGDNDNVVALAVRLGHRLVELVNEREDEPVVFAQGFLQLAPGAGSRRLGIRHPAADECAPDLVIEILAVGHHHEGEIAGHHAPHLFGKERHRVRLAAALRVPEHPQPSQIGVPPPHPRQVVAGAARRAGRGKLVQDHHPGVDLGALHRDVAYDDDAPHRAQAAQRRVQRGRPDAVERDVDAGAGAPLDLLVEREVAGGQVRA